MNKIITISILLLLCFVQTADSQNKKDTIAIEDQVWICVRWKWTSQDTFNKQVICLEWEKKDCSKRLHKELCRLEGRKNQP